MKKIAMTLACAFVAAGMLTGCGSSVDENKTPEEIRQEIADWDAAKIQKVIDEYSRAIAEKTSELAAKTDELKEIPLTEMLGDKAKGIQGDIAEITLHLHPEGARTVGVMDDLDKMGEVALHMVKDAIGAYVQVDLSMAAQVIAKDDDCDAMFRKISTEIAQYIAAHPAEAETALDLFMISKYLERLGDHAVNVAEWVEFLKTGVHKSRKIV